MSVESISRVLNHSRASGTAKLVLVGIANHDGDGGAWPTIATLARYANCSERSVQRAIEQLVALGEVIVHANAGGTRNTPNDRRPNRYEITVSPVDNPVDNSSNGVTPASPREVDGVTPVTQRGDASVVNGVTPVSPEPSLNHPQPAAAGGGDPKPWQIEQLRAGFAAHAALDSISFTMRAPDIATVAVLVERHGVARLVRAAADTKTGNIRRASAFIGTWSELASPLDTTAEPVVERCPVCSQPTHVCDAARRRNPDYCTGRTA